MKGRRWLSWGLSAVLVVVVASLTFATLAVRSTMGQVERADLLPVDDTPVPLQLPEGTPVVDLPADPDPSRTVVAGPDLSGADIVVREVVDEATGEAPQVRTAPEAELAAPDQVAQQGRPVQVIGTGKDALVRREAPPPVVQPPAAPPEDESVTVLLVGSDSRTADVADGRSDVIVVAHVSGDRQRVDLVHVPRDAYVNVPGYGHNKVNAAYAYGGTKLLVQTLQPLLGVRIDHVALTGFDGFSRGIDAVGGVEVDVTQASDAFPVTGPTTLSGDQALVYVRERRSLPAGDLSRGVRQQQVIRSLMVRATSSETLTSPTRLRQLVDALVSTTVVDEALTDSRMVSLATSLRGTTSGDVHGHTMPHLWTRTDPIVGSVVIVDEEGLADLREHLVADDMAGYRP